MAKRVFNFTAGPAQLPLSVLHRVQEELLDFQGLGASIIEISHRSPEFERLLKETELLFRELMHIPDNYKVLFCHGGGQMQFSMVPLNLIGLKPAKKALYTLTGNFAERAAEEAEKYGTIRVIASSKDTHYDRIPEIDPQTIDPGASYLHITTNNTIMGTRWQKFPDTNGVPLVGDATSEILSREIDVTQFGLLFAGAQKNVAPSGLAIVIVREDLLGHVHPHTPKMLNYTQLAKDGSLTNTVNTFAVYVANLVLQWLKNEGGVAAIEQVNDKKAARVYGVIDKSGGFYKPHAQPAHRSTMNITFNLRTPELLAKFLQESNAAGLYALKGHARLGGIRASLYNAMPLEGANALAGFMEEFQKKNG
jgi:phosphoserine aminotransferase